MRKRLVSLILALSVAVTAFAGCGGNEEASESSSETAKEASEPTAETKEITILMPSWQTEGNNRMHQVWSERMNIKINFITAPATAYEEKLSAELAGGDLPDIVSFSNMDSTIPETWVKQGALIPLDDLIAEHGEDYASWINEDNELYFNKIDGKSYFMYQINSFPYMNTVAIRQDWLDKLGMKQPSTLDEWLTVWRAFRDNDPNGNGLKDEIALGGSTSWQMILYSAYSIKYQDNNRFALNTDGTLVPLYEHENYLECLELMASMYAEGLIDPEYLVRDDTTNKQLIITNVLGTMMIPGNECASFTTSIRETSEGAVVQSIAPIQQKDGSNGFIHGRIPTAQCLGITAGAEDPEACMELINYLFTEEGQILTNYGVEGETFDYVDGVPKLKEEYCNWTDLRAWGMNPISLVHPWDGDQFLQVTLAGKTYEELDEVEKLAWHGYFDSADYVFYQLPASVFSGEVYLEYATEVFTELEDMQNNVIMGLASIEDMKALIADLKDYALDDITAEVQANYAAIQ